MSSQYEGGGGDRERREHEAVEKGHKDGFREAQACGAQPRTRRGARGAPAGRGGGAGRRAARERTQDPAEVELAVVDGVQAHALQILCAQSRGREGGGGPSARRDTALRRALRGRGAGAGRGAGGAAPGTSVRRKARSKRSHLGCQKKKRRVKYFCTCRYILTPNSLPLTWYSTSLKKGIRNADREMRSTAWTAAAAAASGARARGETPRCRSGPLAPSRRRAVAGRGDGYRGGGEGTSLVLRAVNHPHEALVYNIQSRPDAAPAARRALNARRAHDRGPSLGGRRAAGGGRRAAGGGWRAAGGGWRVAGGGRRVAPSAREHSARAVPKISHAAARVSGTGR